MITKEELFQDIQVNSQGCISWGMKITVKEGDAIIAESVKRSSINPDYEGDKSSLPELVQKAAELSWTPELIEEYKANLPESEPVVVESSDSEVEPTE